jgi:LDH2 family malate/lactate/ureidoglycolate dehydrogenase
MKGFERICLPGAQSHAKFAERSRHGVPVGEPLLAGLNRLGGELGVGKLG